MRLDYLFCPLREKELRITNRKIANLCIRPFRIPETVRHLNQMHLISTFNAFKDNLECTSNAFSMHLQCSRNALPMQIA
jgi:hypothetical protein